MEGLVDSISLPTAEQGGSKRRQRVSPIEAHQTAKKEKEKEKKNNGGRGVRQNMQEEERLVVYHPSTVKMKSSGRVSIVIF